MSKSFKTNLKHWLAKVFKSENKNRKVIGEIATKIGLYDYKECKRMPEETITDFLFSKIEELKAKHQSAHEIYKFIEIFLDDYNVRVNQKLNQNIEQMIFKYLSSNEENTRNYQEAIANIYEENKEEIECVCSNLRSVDDDIEQEVRREEECYQCGRSFHVDCFWPKINKEEVFQCPFCFLKKCIPNKQIKLVLFAGYMRQTKKEKIQYKINFCADFKKQKYLIQARCVRLDPKSRFELTWPQNCIVSLNHKKLSEFKPLAFNSPLKRRNDEEIIFQRKNLNILNTLIIEEKHQPAELLKKNNDTHLVMLVAYNIIAEIELEKKFRQIKISVDQSKQILKEYLDRGSSQAIIQKISISLRCHYYHNRITLPVRSRHCKSHYQPFDLKSFVIANSHLKNISQKWKCPICRQRAYDLVFDQYIYELIKNKKNLSEITFKMDAQPEFIEQEQAEDESSIQKEDIFVPNPNQILIDLQSSSEEIQSPKKSFNQDPFKIDNCQVIEIEDSEDDKSKSINISSSISPSRKSKTNSNKRTFSDRNISEPLQLQLSRPTKKMIIASDDDSVENVVQKPIKPSHKKSSQGLKKEIGKKSRNDKKEPEKDVFINNILGLKLTKTLKPSPVLQTKIHTKSIKIMSKGSQVSPTPKKTSSFIEPIEIESDEEDQIEIQRNKLQYQKKELQKQKNFMSKNWKQQTDTSESIREQFNEIVSKFFKK